MESSSSLNGEPGGVAPLYDSTDESWGEGGVIPILIPIGGGRSDLRE